MTYQGRILKSDGSALEYSNVAFIFKIMDPTGQCLLYQEQSNPIDMTGSGGVFDVPIGLGSVSYPSSGTTSITDVFNNTTPLFCSGGGTYNPVNTDVRLLRVSFYDGSGWRQISPDNTVRSVPFAAYSKSAESAKKLGTNVAGDFLLKAGLPTCGAGTFLTWNGSALTCGGVSGASGGTVTDVIAGTGLNVGAGPGGTINASGTLNVDVGTTTGKIVQVAASNKLPAIDGSNLTNISASNLSGTVSISNGGSGQSTKTAAFDALSPTTTKGDLILNNGSNNVRVAVGSNGQYLQADNSQASGVKWASVTDTLSGLSCGSNNVPYWNGSAWACRSSSSSNTASAMMLRDAFGNFAANQGTLNSFVLDNGSGANITVTTPVAFTSWQLKLPSTAGTANQVLKTDGSGNTSWATASSQWSDGASSSINYTAGNVGIGTTNPFWKLSVAGGTTGALFTTTDFNTGTSTGSGLAINSGASTGNTTSSIQAYTSGGNAAGNLLLNSTYGFVGVGTLAPTAALHVVGQTGTIPSPNGYPGLIATGGNGWSGVGTGGGIDLTGGNGSGTGTGGAINLTAGSGGATNINGANVVINGGAKGGSGTDGNVILASSRGYVGVGTTTPAAKLEVAGDVKVGNSSATCNGTTKGSIRYNNTTSVLEFCNGTAWNLVQAAACSDYTPNVFTFLNEANATISTLTTSDIVQVTGINCSVPVTISGNGSPMYRICNDSGCGSVVQDWTTSPSSITTGQYMQLKLTTDAAGGVSSQATVIVGSNASVWSVSTTGDCSTIPTTYPAIGTVCADGTVYAGLSPDGNAAMYATRCDSGQTWDGSNCTGGAITMSWNNGVGFVQTFVTGGTTGKSNTTTLAGLSDGGAPYAAANYCETLNLHGKTDWYLPAYSELNILYVNKAVIRNFDTSGANYWSCTESISTGSSHASYQRFSDGFQSSNFKFNGYKVRCVRR